MSILLAAFTENSKFTLGRRGEKPPVRLGSGLELKAALSVSNTTKRGKEIRHLHEV